MQHDGIVAIECTDFGCGMHSDVMEKLNSGTRVTTKNEKGEHGLGFLYCKKLAEEMEGDLYVKESIVGMGTTVVFELKHAD